MRSPKPWFRASHDAWYVQHRGKQVLLAKGKANKAEAMGIPGATMLYRWRREERERCGPMAASLDSRVHELEEELRRVKTERDILKKCLAILGRSS